MFRTILVPIALDNKETGQKALEIAKGLREDGGAITLMHVLEEIPGWVMSQLPQGITEETRDEAVATLHQLAEGAGPGIEVTVVYGHAGRTIVDRAESLDADCIVISSHRPGLQDYFLGSTAATVSRHAQCSVLILR